MATVRCLDGAEIYFDVAGEDGPLVAFAPFWNMIPSDYVELLGEVARDHRILTYHLRGTGKSERGGPYDMETDAGDLERVLEHLSAGPAVLISVGNSSNWAMRLAARRPDLAAAVAALGNALAPGPLALRNFSDDASMVASEAVVEVFMEMMSRDHRAAMRTVLTASRSDMTEEERHESVLARVEHVPQDAALGRLSAWMKDDPEGVARELGDRLWLITGPTIAGAWMPDFDDTLKAIEERLPSARIEIFDDIRGRPAEGADLIRRIITLALGLASETDSS